MPVTNPQTPIRTANIVDNAVTTAKIADDAITTAKILNDAVTTAKILNDAITTLKILDGAVTTAKLSPDVLFTRLINPSFPLMRNPFQQAFGAAGRVWLLPIDVCWTVVVDRIVFSVGVNSAGNIRVGIYRSEANPDDPTGEELVVESASVAQAAANVLQYVTIADTTLTTGRYWIAVQGSDALGEFFRINLGTTSPANLQAWLYNRAGGYGAFTDPCPALATTNLMPILFLRVAENLP